MNLNSQQALQDEELGEEELDEDIDYDALYGGIDIDYNPQEISPEIKKDYKQIFGDVAKQGVKETLIGIGGAWGDLAELAGINGGQTEGAKTRNSVEFEILKKMEQPGYKPSFSDIYALNSEDDIAPQAFGFPTSENLRGVNESIGGPGEPETTEGRFAGRIGKHVGQGLAFGQVNPLPGIAAGVAGQSVEELGGDPLTQAAAEIAGLLLTPSGKAKALSSVKETVKKSINELRNLGYTDEQITLAINSANKNSKAAKIASKGKKTEQAFEDFAEHSDDLINNILTKEIPGIEKNIGEVHELASSAYGKVAEDASNVVIKDSSPFVKSVKWVENELKKNLGLSDDSKKFIERINEAAESAKNNPSAESMMNFYKELNKAGKWMGRSEKDRLITHVKDGIKDTFRSQGKEGSQLADNFEKANKGIRKAYLAEDVNDIISKSKVDGKIDYKKLNKSLNNEKNTKLFEEVLGKSESKNLKTISNIGKQVKDFDKSWKAANSFSNGVKLDTLQGGAALYYMYQGDWKALAAVAGMKGSSQIVKKIAEKSLTDPKFQNLIIKGLHAIKTESPRLMKTANEGIKKYLDEEGLSIPNSENKNN